MASFNLADLFEVLTDAIPDREAMVAGTRRLTFRQLDERANRLAHHLAGAGVGRDDHVGLHLLNGTEYIEGMLAAFKLRAVPVNINYRYVERELAYLYDNADLRALIYHRQFGPRVAAVAPSIDGLDHLLVLEDGSEADVVPGSAGFDDALAAASPDRDFAPRSSDDRYIAYTGGTTGMPKGVVWRHEDIFFGALGGGDVFQTGEVIAAPEQLGERVPEHGMVSLQVPPFMHVSAHWSGLSALFGGGKIVIAPPGPFDADATLRTMAAEGVNILTIVGDAMARPLIDALRAGPGAHDLSALFVIGSGGAVLSPANRQQLRELLPNVIIIDGFGSSESGVMGTKRHMPGEESTGGSQFVINAETAVLDDDLCPVTPGSGVVGRLARRGRIPLEYYKDPEKTAATFVEHGGARWVLPGDFAVVEDDGTVTLLGRGSVSINTGGEKVYPEEVERVLHAHPAVYDVLVVGVPDERWGERVVAVVRLSGGASLTLDEVDSHCRAELAGYKIPRDLVLVDEIVRSPSGKADYPWARAEARRRLLGS
jgi:3-oxocholest-4-en-26-oate---CoA ligase